MLIGEVPEQHSGNLRAPFGQHDLALHIDRREVGISFFSWG